MKRKIVESEIEVRRKKGKSVIEKLRVVEVREIIERMGEEDLMKGLRRKKGSKRIRNKILKLKSLKEIRVKDNGEVCEIDVRKLMKEILNEIEKMIERLISEEKGGILMNGEMNILKKKRSRSGEVGKEKEVEELNDIVKGRDIDIRDIRIEVDEMKGEDRRREEEKKEIDKRVGEEKV